MDAARAEPMIRARELRGRRTPSSNCSAWTPTWRVHRRPTNSGDRVAFSPAGAYAWNISHHGL
ncbi:hypothetical protein [Streptomyces sp. NBC_01235]|uniref:hypothetical protein n=1 Tax=Streptomyces sp. NBC_01235 TaxID=2903788 RepID=UPI002E0FF5AC